MSTTSDKIGLWGVLLERPKVAWLLIAAIMGIGVYTYNAIPKESTPTVDIPAAVVTTVWPGAGAEDVEQLVTDVLEREIQTLQALDTYSSTSSAGLSVINVEFPVDADKNESLQKLREKVDAAARDLPSTLPDSPQVNEISISDVPVVAITLSGDVSWSELRGYATLLEESFEGVAQVKRVDVTGAPEEEIHIIIDPVALESYALTVEDITRALRAAHTDVPLGTINADGQRVQISAKGRLRSLEEIRGVVVLSDGITQVTLGAIARVQGGFADFTNETYFYTPEGGARPSVSLSVVKSASKGNVLLMVEDVIARVDQLRVAGELPDTIQTEVTYNRADEIRDSLETLTGSGSQTLLLIALVMLIALGFRESLLASLSIPLSMFLAIAYLSFSGETFNGVSLFALVLGIGLLVDNAIIVVEGLHDAVTYKKMTPLEAAVDTIQTYKAPIITGTLTTICAFLPMLWFITGVSGDYVSVIPKTVTAVLIAALIASLFLLPVVGLWFYKKAPKEHRDDDQPTRLARAQAWYSQKMTHLLKQRFGPLMAVSVAIVAMVLSFGLVASKAVPVEVFPGSNFPYFAAQIELPEGTSADDTEQLLAPTLSAIAPFFDPQGADAETWLKSVTATIGQGSNLISGGGSGSHVLGLTFSLTDAEDRDTPSYIIAPEIEIAMRDALPEWAVVRLVEEQAGPPTGAPIELRITADSTQRLDVLLKGVLEKLEPNEKLLNLRSTRTAATTLQEWEFDRARLAYFGLTPSAMSESLRAAINGTTVLQVTQGGDEIDVKLRLSDLPQWESPTDLSAAGQIPLRTAAGPFVPLSEVATSQLKTEQSQLQRRDGDLVYFVRAELPEGITADMLQSDLLASVADLELLPNESISIGGEAEEGNRLIEEMLLAMSTAVLLILVVLVWQFGSFHQSFITLMLIPLSLTGVFVGFWLTGLTITFPTMIGIVSLAGIIVNDAIVLIDRYNVALRDGLERSVALVQAGTERLQPIFLTSITTVVGMLPLSLSDEVWGGLGFAIVYGMSISTIICLLLAPCLIRLYFQVRGRLARLFRRGRSA